MLEVFFKSGAFDAAESQQSSQIVASSAFDRPSADITNSFARGSKDFLFREFPESFDEIKVRGIRRQKEQLDAKSLSHRSNDGTTLIACVVENNRDGDSERLPMECSEFTE